MIFRKHQTILKLIHNKMSSFSNVLKPPSDVRGMKTLDTVKFLRYFQVPILKVSEINLPKITRICKKYFLKMEKFKPVQNCDTDNEQHLKKMLLLNPEKIENWTDISREDRESLNLNGIQESQFGYKEIQFSYDNWRYEAIFKSVLPENEDIVSGFSQIGHIIHLNLRDHLLDYKHLIGQVLIDKIKTCRTVVNKSNIIDNTYRNFSMEVIAGENDFLVSVKENMCNFQFDFSKVYWNPRLCKEHERILNSLKKGDVLFDVFCGVGPFAIPAAKRKCFVYANDLNPESFKWLNHNAKKNKVDMTSFKSFNQDGKDFICVELRDFLIHSCRGKQKLNENAKVHITMNLPAMAVEFLKYFKGLIQEVDLLERFDCEVIIHVYCFAVGDDSVSVAKNMVNENFGCDVSSNILEVFNVRKVSPKKEMMRVTLKLTKEIIFSTAFDLNSEPPCKKLCA